MQLLEHVKLYYNMSAWGISLAEVLECTDALVGILALCKLDMRLRQHIVKDIWQV